MFLDIKKKKTNKSQALIKELSYIESNLNEYVNSIHKTLLTESYNPGVMKIKTIKEGTKKKTREITIPDIFSQCVQHAVIDSVILPRVKARGYYYDCGNIETSNPYKWITKFANNKPRKVKVKNAGKNKAVRAAKKFMHSKRNKYFGQFDIHHFYQSIPHDRLLYKIKRNITKDPKTLNIISIIIKSGRYDDIGLDIGFYSSPVLSVFYLQDLNFAIKQKFAKDCDYVKYVDDGVIIGPNKRKIEKTIKLINEFLKNDGLRLKGLWRVREINTNKMLFLGYRFSRDFLYYRKISWLKYLELQGNLQIEGLHIIGL